LLDADEVGKICLLASNVCSHFIWTSLIKIFNKTFIEVHLDKKAQPISETANNSRWTQDNLMIPLPLAEDKLRATNDLYPSMEEHESSWTGAMVVTFEDVIQLQAMIT